MTPNRARVLCVDDEPSSLKLLDAILAPRGFEVIPATNGREALSIMDRRDIDIVLLDVMLPEVSGFDVCRMIKENERHRSVPVVMITALRAKQDRIKGIEAGAEDFISKPFDQPELIARIGMLLKIKDLSDRLNFAYRSINDLIAYGEEAVKRFDPLNFDLGHSIESVVHQILRKGEGSDREPEIIIVGINEGPEQRRWTAYRFSHGGVRSEPIDAEINVCPLVSTGEARMIIVATEEDFDRPENRRLGDVIKKFGKNVSNLASYHSADLCVYALDYRGGADPHDAAVLNSLVMQTMFLKSLSSQVKETDDAFAYTVRALVRAAEVNDEDTGNHITRVGEYSALLAQELGMPDKFVSIIRLQAQMHDVGKMHVPASILRKPDRLTSEEFEIVKMHPEYGSKIIGDHMRLTMARTIALTHHERWDGSGYPSGLKREDIPIEGRISNLADIYDALRNERSYKPAFSHETAFRIITEGDGRTMPDHFDPAILDAFVRRADGFDRIYSVFRDQSCP